MSYGPTMTYNVEPVPAPVSVAMMLVAHYGSRRQEASSSGIECELTHHEQESHEVALNLVSEYMRSSPIMARANLADKRRRVVDGT